VVKEYERAIILRLGENDSLNPEGPGLIFFLPCIDDVHIVDQRIINYKIPPQEVGRRRGVPIGSVIKQRKWKEKKKHQNKIS